MQLIHCRYIRRKGCYLFKNKYCLALVIVILPKGTKKLLTDICNKTEAQNAPPCEKGVASSPLPQSKIIVIQFHCLGNRARYTFLQISQYHQINHNANQINDMQSTYRIKENHWQLKHSQTNHSLFTKSRSRVKILKIIPF